VCVCVRARARACVTLVYQSKGVRRAYGYAKG